MSAWSGPPLHWRRQAVAADADTIGLERTVRQRPDEVALRTPGDRVTLTPHCAWQSPWTWVRDSQEIWFNVLRSLRGEPLEWLV